MSTRSGKLTQRRVVYNNHKGYDIVQVTIKRYWKPSYQQYYTNIIDKVERYFTFCEHGAGNRPSMEYNLYPEPKTIDEVKECIDKFLEDDTLYFTEGERQKYVYEPNHKNGWGFSKKTLLDLFKKWKKASPRIKLLYEDRLTDANFHSECDVLSTKGYDAAVAWVENHWND